MELVLIYTKNEGAECTRRFVRLQAWGKNEYPNVYSVVLFKLSDSKNSCQDGLKYSQN